MNTTFFWNKILPREATKQLETKMDKVKGTLMHI